MNKTLVSPKNILVIEDDNALLGAITAKLEGAKFTVITARSVDEAFGIAHMSSASLTLTPELVTNTINHVDNLARIDAIWLDHNLISIDDGLDFIVKFKANGGAWGRIPIFVVSNSANPDLIKTYAAIGVNHYYLKAEYRLETIVNDIITTIDTVSP